MSAGEGDSRLPDWVARQMLDRRMVFLRGPLDDVTVGRAAAELMMLDATGDTPVELQLDSPGGDLSAGFSLVDIIEALGVPVHATCMGRAEGVAVAVFAVADRRLASPHARFHLTEPPASVAGSAQAMAALSHHHSEQVARLVAILARACHRPAEHVEADLAMGRWMGAQEAVAYGLADVVLTPRRHLEGDPGRKQGRPPLGFSPPQSG